MLHAAGKDMGKLFLFAFLCSCNTELRSLHRVLILQCRDLNNLAAKLLPELLNVNVVTVLTNQIHHVDCNYDRNSDLNQLCGQIQVTLNICSVNDIQDCIRLLVYDVVTGYHFLKRVRTQGINTRKVLDDDVLMLLQASFLFLDRNARPVSDILVAAGQIVEQGCLAAVRVAGQCDFDFHLTPPLLLLRHFQNIRIFLPERQLITANGYFYRVSERSDFSNIDLRSFGDSHIHDASFQSAFSMDLRNDCGLSDCDIPKCLHASVLLIIQLLSAPADAGSADHDLRCHLRRNCQSGLLQINNDVAISAG